MKHGEVLAEVHRIHHRAQQERAAQRDAALDALASIFSDRAPTGSPRSSAT